MIKYFLKLFEDYNAAMRDAGFHYVCVYGGYYVLIFETFDETEKHEKDSI